MKYPERVPTKRIEVLHSTEHRARPWVPRAGAAADVLLSRLPSKRIVALLPVNAGLLFVVAVAITIAVGIVYQTQLDLVRRTHEVARETAQFLSTMQDAELGQRGYLLTGDDIYLTRYNAARAEVAGRLATLNGLAVDKGAKSMLAELGVLADRRIALLGRTLAMYRAGDSRAAVARLAKGAGRANNDALREVITRLENRLAELLRVRSETARNSAAILVLFFALTVGLAIIAVMLWWRDRQASAETASVALANSEAARKTLASAIEKLRAEGVARKTAESKVRQLQKMEAVSRLSGGIAHDFNNMLSVIIAAISLTKRRMAKGDTDVGALLDGAIDGATRAAALTARLSAFSRQKPLAPVALDLSTFVGDMTELLQRTLGETIRVETVLGGGLWRAYADTSELENAVLNLAVNARDAMPEGGRLTLETSNVSLDIDYAAAHEDVAAGQYVLIAVSDSGSGTSPEVLERAFEPFYTTKPVGAGTGLGLSQVFGFIKQSGGHVNILSEIGKGTTVKLYLPRYFGEDDRVVRPAPADPVQLRADKSCGVILLVEDEERLREVTVASLRDLEYKVIHAAGGEEALLLLDAHPEIGCLFTDILMPGMNGRELANEALRRRPDLKVLYTSGYVGDAVEDGVLDSGVNYLAKPYALDNLVLKLRSAAGATV